MKYLKIVLISFTMSMLIISCSKDKSTNPINDNGNDNTNTNNIPALKVTIITTLDNEQIDSREINGKDGEYSPEGTTILGYYYNLSKAFDMDVIQISNNVPTLTLNFAGLMQKLEKNKYSYNENDEGYEGGVYYNTKISDAQFKIASAEISISDVKYIGFEQAGTSYISGSMSITLDSEDGNKSGYLIAVNFEGFPLATANTKF